MNINGLYDPNSFNVMGSPPNSSAWSNVSELFTSVMGYLNIMFSNPYLLESLKYLILGSVVESGRRLCLWLVGRFRFQYSIAAQFDEDDPAYEWIVHFLTQENVWQGSRNFRITSKTCKRKWGIKTGSNPMSALNADYVPTYEKPQLFRWKGYWVEIQRTHSSARTPGRFSPESHALLLRVFTFDMAILSGLVEEAHRRYVEVNRPNVTIHLVDSPNGGLWSNVKRKFRRPLGSIILQQGVIESLLSDAREFIDNEDWYIEAGIPYRRGYLLAGPPGTGKTSTIYTIAGELGLEIYSISLASGFVDDAFLQLAASSIPKSSIFLIEDIDCAFSSREDGQHQSSYQDPYRGSYGMPGRRSAVTLSGLLNVIDGVGSEEGKLFFATTNYIDRLDPALLRPGRIDMKILYGLATQAQAKALFIRFYPESRFGLAVGDVSKLAEDFSALIPENEFSTAELQGYLLMCKKQPVEAAAGVTAWIEQERTERRERDQREKQKNEKATEAMAQRMSRATYAPFYPIYPAYPAQAYPVPAQPTSVETDVPSELPSTVPIGTESSTATEEC